MLLMPNFNSKTPVDATNVPPQLCNGFSTMFCSFHHMTEKSAMSILQGNGCAHPRKYLFNGLIRRPNIRCGTYSV